MKEKVSRREFIATTAAVGVCMCGLNGCNFILPYTGDTPQIHPPTYEIAASNGTVEIIIDTVKIPDMLNEGNAIKIIDPKIHDRIIIANPGDNQLIAMSSACTHKGAEVEYIHDKKMFKCVSFNRAEFSLEGKSTDTMNLKTIKSYPLRRQNDKLVILLSA
ncbi:MAG: Rieske 2Fe-2S domain-containing protein [Desulfatirhabdiaceae bacterium]